MTLEQIITIATALVTYIFGLLAKKWNWIESKYIPVQNLIIGFVVAISYYCLIDNSNVANAVVMAFSGLISGGAYDLINTNKEE